MKTSLTKNTCWIRTLYVDVNGKSTQLGDIIVYDDKGIICSVGRGFFDNDEEITIEGEVALRRVVNLGRKENFVVKTEDTAHWEDPKYDLYIYKGNVDLQFKGARKEYDTVYQIYTVNGAEIRKRIKDLSVGKWEIRDKMDVEVKKLEGYKLPLNEDEMAKTLKNIKKYNKQLLDIEKYVKEYVPTEEDNKEER